MCVNIPQDCSRFKRVLTRAAEGGLVEGEEPVTREALQVDMAQTTAQLAEVHLEQGQYDQAIAEFTEAIEHHKQWSFFYGRGRAYYGARRFSEAIPNLSSAVHTASKPREAVAGEVRSHIHALLGECHYHVGDFDKALLNLDRAIDLCPEYSSARSWRGLFHHERGDHAKALADLNEAIRLNPEDPLPYESRAKVHRTMGDKENALKDEQSCQAAKLLADAWSEMEQSNWDAAIFMLTQAMRLDATMLRPYNRRGMAYCGKGELDLAIADFNHVIERTPTPDSTGAPLPVHFADAYAWRAGSLAKQGQYDKAIADYSEAIRLAPYLANVYQARADAYRALGDMENAAEDERKARKLLKSGA